MHRSTCNRMPEEWGGASSWQEYSKCIEEVAGSPQPLELAQTLRGLHACIRLSTSCTPSFRRVRTTQEQTSLTGTFGLNEGVQ